MARIRTVKPQHWSDRELTKISLQAHLLWIALWNFSDDEGIFENDSILIRSNVFPRRTDVRTEQVSQWLDQLVKARFIIPFTFNGEGYYIHRTFKTHQKIDKPQKSKIPDNIIRGILSERSMNDQPCIVVDSIVEESIVDAAHENFNGKKTTPKNKKEKEENSPGPENWNTRPGPAEMDLQLPEIKAGSVIELFKITKHTDVDIGQVLGLWSIFKSQHFNGEKFYQSKSEVFSHFINWSKGQTINKYATHKQSFTKSSGGKSAGANQLLDSLKADLASLAGSGQ